MRGAATEQARRNTATVDRDRPVSRTRVYTEAELDKFDGYDNVYENAKPNYSSPRLRGYEDPQPRRRSSRPRSAPTDIRDEPRRASRNRPEPRYSGREPVREVESDYAPRTSEERYGYEDPSPRRPRRRPTAPVRDAYDEWDDTPQPSRPRRRPSTPPVDDYARRPSTFSEEPYPTAPPTEPPRRPRPADLGRSYEPDNDYDNYGGEDLGRSYDDSDLGRSYEDDAPIPGDYVVDYQPLDDMGTDYTDDDDDSYDDYESPEDVDDEDDYDEYNNRPERRTPINLNNDKNYD